MLVLVVLVVLVVVLVVVEVVSSCREVRDRRVDLVRLLLAVVRYQLVAGAELLVVVVDESVTSSGRDRNELSMRALSRRDLTLLLLLLLLLLPAD